MVWDKESPLHTKSLINKHFEEIFCKNFIYKFLFSTENSAPFEWIEFMFWDEYSIFTGPENVWCARHTVAPRWGGLFHYESDKPHNRGASLFPEASKYAYSVQFSYFLFFWFIFEIGPICWPFFFFWLFSVDTRGSHPWSTTIMWLSKLSFAVPVGLSI